MNTTAQQQRRRGVALVEWGTALLGACLLVLIALRSASPPPLGAFAAFAVLLLLSEHAAVSLPSTVRVSPAFMVVMASITAFDGHGVVLGAALLGACGGLVLPLLRAHRFRTVAFNCGQYVVAGTAAAVVHGAVVGPSPFRQAAAGLAAGAIFATANVTLVLVGIVSEGHPPSEVWRDMAPTIPNYLIFGLLGVLVGHLYGSLHPLALVLFVTPLAVARLSSASQVRLQQAQDATVAVFLRAIDAKDPYTAEHTRRVTRYCRMIGEQMGFTRGHLEHLERAALLHDIGKLAVPRALLNKPDKLTDAEFVEVQRHAHVCIEILECVDFLRPMVAAASGHHTRYDGGGYGGTGTVSVDALVVAVADAYDAMTSSRAYRRALPQQVAFTELRSKAGTQFHPGAVEALIGALEERGEEHGLGHERSSVVFQVPPPVVGLGSAGLGDRMLPSARSR